MTLPLARGVFTPVAPGDRSADWAVTGRLGGVSTGEFTSANLADHVGDAPVHVAHNRDRVARLVGLTGTNLAIMAPVHGAAIATVESPGVSASVDSLITRKSEIALLALGADCATVGIYGSGPGVPGIIAAVHCGWKGLCADVLGETVQAVQGWGATHVECVLGPAICGRCYQVPSDRGEAVRDLCTPSIASAALHHSGGIDVRRGLEVQLAELGIPFQSMGGCTYENTDQLFSYRRNSITGRQGLVVAMRPHSGDARE